MPSFIDLRGEVGTQEHLAGWSFIVENARGSGSQSHWTLLCFCAVWSEHFEFLPLQKGSLYLWTPKVWSWLPVPRLAGNLVEIPNHFSLWLCDFTLTWQYLRVEVFISPNESWHQVGLCVTAAHWCIFFGSVSLEVACPLLSVFVLLFLSCKNSLQVLAFAPLPVIWFANIFSHFVDLL